MNLPGVMRAVLSVDRESLIFGNKAFGNLDWIKTATLQLCYEFTVGIEQRKN